MLELGEGVGVEEVTGAVDDTDIEGCTELLIDVATLDTDLVDVETLDTLALLDSVREGLDAALLVCGGANELDVIWVDVGWFVRLDGMEMIGVVEGFGGNDG